MDLLLPWRIILILVVVVVVVVVSGKDHGLTLCKIKPNCRRALRLKRPRLSQNNLANDRGIPSRVMKGPPRSPLNHRIPPHRCGSCWRPVIGQKNRRFGRYKYPRTWGGQMQELAELKFRIPSTRLTSMRHDANSFINCEWNRLLCRR